MNGVALYNVYSDMTLEQVKDSVFIVVITVHSNRMFLIFWNLSMTKAQ